ncbi:hypothetical protein K501DRAFT_216338 [Backusella circina FSU 941]|nr:hypothetical protein K501DRAFT_216338 [Backusella circina FSU 941]
MAKKLNKQKRKIVTADGEVLDMTEPIPTDELTNDVLEREVSAPDSSIVDADEANKTMKGSFWARVCSIPIIQQGTTTVQDYANKTSISRFALETVQSTIHKASEMATPLAAKYKNQLERADRFGCQSLDTIEQRFPVVMEQDIIAQVKATPRHVYQGVKDRINTAVSVPVSHANDNIEYYVNRWLPQQDEQADGEKKNKEDDETKRLVHLANEVRERIACRLHSAIPHSKADISRLAETNHLLHEASQSITGAYTRLHEMVISVRGGYQEKANKRIHELTMDLIKRLDIAAAYIKEHPVNLPGPLHVVVDPLVSFATNEYEIVRTEVLKSDVPPLQKATNIMQLTQAYVLPLIQNSLDGIQEQMRYYRVYASKNKVVNDVKQSLGIKA